MEKITKKEVKILVQNLREVRQKINELKKQLDYYSKLEEEGSGILHQIRTFNPELLISEYN